jgi:hypothetical protein
MSFTQQEMSALQRLRRMIEEGRDPITDHDLVADLEDAIAATETSDPVVVKPYENGVIVGIKGVAYAAAGDAEADTMHPLVHAKYLGIKIEHAGKPKTNGAFESLFVMTGRRFWHVKQGDQITCTFKHLASGGIASLKAQIKFGFIPFSLLTVGI